VVNGATLSWGMQCLASCISSPNDVTDGDDKQENETDTQQDAQTD